MRSLIASTIFRNPWDVRYGLKIFSTGHITWEGECKGGGRDADGFGTLISYKSTKEVARYTGIMLNGQDKYTYLRNGEREGTFVEGVL